MLSISRSASGTSSTAAAVHRTRSTQEHFTERLLSVPDPIADGEDTFPVGQGVPITADKSQNRRICPEELADPVQGP